MSHSSSDAVRGWRIAALTAPVVWVLAGLVPTVWGWTVVNRFEDQGPAVSLVVGIILTLVVELIALPTLAISASNPTSRSLGVLALFGHAALVLVSLLAWAVVSVDRPIDVVSLTALTAVSVASAVAWIRLRQAPRSRSRTDA